MKLKPLSKKIPVEKTPLGSWIRIATVACCGVSILAGTYIYYFHAEGYLRAFGALSDSVFTDERRKQVWAENKPLQENAYKNYLQEKKTYEKELEEETKKRLETLQAKYSSNQSAAIKTSKPTSNPSTTSTTSTTSKKPSPSSSPSSPPTDPEKRAKWAYLKFVEITNK